MMLGLCYTSSIIIILGVVIKMNMDKNIKMKEVKEKTGLTSRQIRYYDDQDLIFPARSSGNQRLFSKNDIKRLLKIKEMIAAGDSIETIRIKLKVPDFNEEGAITENHYEFENDYYSDIDLDSLYPVSNRYALIKKLSQNNKRSQEEEI